MAETIATPSQSDEITTSPVALCVESLGKAYDTYRSQRKILHYLQTGNQNAAEQFHAVLHAKEGVADAASDLYATIGPNLPRFTDSVASALQSGSPERQSTQATAKEIILGAYVTPLSLLEGDRTPTAIESVMISAENTVIAERFAAVGRGTLTSLALSGATAWGAFYATRGRRTLAPKETKPENRSDIDLLAIAQDIDSVGNTIQNYVAAGLLDAKELERFNEFKKLQQNDQVDVFSVRSRYKGVEQSIHFLTHDVLDAIIGIRPIRAKRQNGNLINFVRDFRPNLPNNPQKNGGGYTIDDLKNLQRGRPIFRPEVAPAENGLGYISELPVGSVLKIRGEHTYSMGVLDFFVAIQKTLHDTDGWFQDRAARLHQTIANIQGSREPMNIPREFRMSESAKQHIKNRLQLPS